MHHHRHAHFTDRAKKVHMMLFSYIHSLYRKKKYFHRWISIDSRIYENDAKKNPSILIFFSNTA